MLLSAPASGEPRSEVRLAQSGCLEVPVPRAASTSLLDPLVPDRYELVPVNATYSRLWVYTVTCDTTTVDGHRTRTQEPITLTIGAVQVSARDGVATGFATYVLWYGTDDPVSAAKLRQLGLPVSFLPRREVEVDPGEVTSAVRWIRTSWQVRAFVLE